MKKITAIFLAVVMCALLMPVTSFAAEEQYPVEERFSENGTHAVKTQKFESNEKSFEYYRVWYPEDLSDIKGNLPVIIYCNGTGVKDTDASTEKMLTAFTSWGYICLSNDHEATGNGDSAHMGLELLIKLNGDESSIFHNKINLDAVGLIGHSQGGSAVINAASEGKYENSGMIKAICAISAPHSELAASFWQNTPYDASKVKVPAFLIGGTTTDEAGTETSSGISPLGMGLIANMNSIQNDNVVIGRIKGASHADTPGLSIPYAIAWFNWILLDDNFSASAFKGENPEIFGNEKWQDVYNKQSENLPENPDPYDPETEAANSNIFTKLIEKIIEIIMTVLNIVNSIKP